jgi:molybdate transport repressor ModE-like protein
MPDKKTTKIDISLLQTFHLVVKTGSFSSASRELGISYQTAANHVRRLEVLYGAKLVEAEKGSRIITLTPQGKALNASLGSELDTILSRISVLLHDVHSVLRVGVPQTIFHHFFPKILTEFRKGAPEIELDFFERDTILEKMMLDGTLDACVSERFFGQPVVTQTLLGEYHLCLVYPRDWIGENENVDIRFFASKPFITYEPGQTIRSRSVDFLGECFNAPPKFTTTASGSTSVARLVEAGIGYGIVPEWSVKDNDPMVAKLRLEGLQRVKVYFGHSTFLESNEYIRLLSDACNQVMKRTFFKTSGR